jgi:alpha-tubulin suppressor-like RCC1 family protein
LVFAVLALVIAGGGYQVYRSGAWLPIQPEAAPVVEPTPPPIAHGPATLTPLVRDGLQGRAGSAVVLEVRARGPGSNPLTDSLVHFRVMSGGGVIDPDTARTDAEGIASASLTLPSRAGTVLVLAGLAGSGTETRLLVSVRAGAPQRLVATGGDRQRQRVGELLPDSVSVIVYDDSGVPVPGAAVSFSVGSGQVAPSRPIRTDSLGTAWAWWRLGNDTGTHQLTVTAEGVNQAVTFTATAIALPAAGDGNPRPAEMGPVSVQRRDFVVGGSHVCALESGTARCWGANERGQLGTSGTGGFAALASGISHMCGLDATGEASCWGANQGGQLGDGSRTDRRSPVPVRTDLRFSSLTAGASHTCGLAGGGIPVCWGQNLSGQIGDGSRTDARFPRAVGGGLAYRTLVAGWNHTCGLSTSGNAFCWGQNSDGQLGDGSRVDQLVPVLVKASVGSLAAGSSHTCGISGDQVLCWGDNRDGQLGNGTTQDSPQPVQVVGLPMAATQITAGAVHACALLADGSAYCWGQNLHGRLGDGSITNRDTAVAVTGGLRFRSIHAGGAVTCGLATDETQYCWGFNQNGELGDGTRESRSVPTQVRR